MTAQFQPIESTGKQHKPNKHPATYPRLPEPEVAPEPDLSPRIEPSPRKAVRTVQTDVLGSVHDGKRHQAPTPCDYKGTA